MIEELVPSDSSLSRVLELLEALDADYTPALSSIVHIHEYAAKLLRNAVVCLARLGGRDVGLVAVYVNDQATRCAYISTIATHQDVRGQGVGMALMESALNIAETHAMDYVRLEVSKLNKPAIRLYKRMGFREEKNSNQGTYEDSVLMEKSLGSR